MEVQGREALINKLLVGLNQNQFISIEWIDTKEIPLEEEKAFTVNEGKKNLDNSIERTGRSRMKLGFIGTGNMAGAIMGGIIKNGVLKPEEIIGSDILEAGREKVHSLYGICVTDDNKEAAKAEIVFFL